MSNFGKNPWGIMNNAGQELTPDYIKTFISSYCRGPNFQYNRKDNMAFLTSDEFLAPLRGQSISEICKIAKSHECWGHADQVEKRSTGKSVNGAAPVFAEGEDYVPQHLRAGKIFYRLSKGSVWYTGDRKNGPVGYQTDAWLAPVATPLSEVWEMFQSWVAEDSKRLQQAVLELA